MGSGRQTLMLGAAAMVLSVLVPCLASAGAQSSLVGTVTDFHGKYGLVVRDASGRVVDVALHPGTVIKPEGLRLERGMTVTILGQATDRTFAAGEIDTAYSLPPARPKALNSLAGPNDSRHASGADSARSNEAPNETKMPFGPRPPR